MTWRWVIFQKLPGEPLEIVYNATCEAPPAAIWPFDLSLPRLVVRQGMWDKRTETQIFIREDLIDA